MSFRTTISGGNLRSSLGDVHRKKHPVRLQARALEEFRSEVWDFWKREGRHDLPWRKTKGPYKVLVSEVMLQQTQVPRVIEKYTSFLKKFPTVEALARAPLSEVLREWSGLGYNRRGKFLRDAAIVIVEAYDGRVPKDVHALRAIPGIGNYTASAIRAFAFNLPGTLIETNIRTAYIHYFFADKKQVSDAAILAIADKAAQEQDPREWHWALMDYGAFIKKTHGNLSRKSAIYTKQSKFEGSLRQVRGAIMKALSVKGSLSHTALLRLPFEKVRLELALVSLVKDRLVKKAGARWKIV